MDIKAALADVVSGRDLEREQMSGVMHQIMTGQTTPALISGFLVALRMKGETVDEITGAADVMRSLVTPVDVGFAELVDTCGTGGDGSNLFNVSTACAFVVAAAGGRVAKHGNRSVTSTAGSADVLEAAGINLALTPVEVARCISEVGVGFMFAPAHHGAMKHAIGVRRELGLRTIFNILGPLTNPAGARRQLLGVYDRRHCGMLAEVLRRLGSEHVMVVHADDGLDEISLAASTFVAELKDGVVREYEIDAGEFGIQTADLVGLSVESAAQSLRLINDALGSRPSAIGQKAGDLIALNAGASLYVAGISSSLAEGVLMAQDIIASGLAAEKIRQLAEFTACCGDLATSARS